MKYKSLNTRLTNEDFVLIKRLLSLKLTRPEISDISKRSLGTINAFANVDTFEEYSRKRKERLKKYENNKEILKNFADGIFDEEKQRKSLEQLTVKTKNIPVIEEPNSINETLIRIAEALERLATAWEKEPTKKGWLK